MRKLLAFLVRPIVWSTGGLLVLLLALHIVCPLLGVEEDKRWIIELVVGGPLAVFLVVYWIRQFLIERRLSSDMASQAKRHALQQGPDALRDFKGFSEEFTRAFAQLNQQCRERGLLGGVASLPWVMILGPSGVGKSTALERSGLRFTSLGRRLQGIGGTRNCTWWLANDAVFLDTAGRYAVRDEDRDEWRAFLHLLRKRRRRPIDAVLLQVGIDELLDRPRAEVERAALQLRERLDELSTFLDAQVPVHLLFNKCDLIDGFGEFFGGLDQDAQALPWGFRLDTQALSTQPLGDAFAKHFAELVRALTERTTTRLLALSEQEPREAALGFPAELAAIGSTLGFFTDTLFEPRARGDRPWLCAVYLGSAEQTGQRATGLRQRRAEELALSSGGRGRQHAALPSTGTGGETFFLRGVFAQVLRQAETAARPSVASQHKMRLHQRMAVGLAIAACIGGSWYLGERYSAATLWLDQLVTRSKRMQEGADIPSAAARTTKEEMLAEITRQEALRVWLADAPAGMPMTPAAEASALLRRRVEKEWLRPLQSQMQQDLERAASRQGTDPGEEFSRGFGMLRLAYVLRGNVCSGTDPGMTRDSLAQYIMEHWQRALGERGRWLELAIGDEEDPDRPRTASIQLRRQLEFLFQQDAAVLRDTVHLQIDDALREQARDVLRTGDPSSVVFNLRASLTSLYERSRQLSTPLLSENGIERVFTTKGCATFFGPEAGRGSEWWKCVLDRPLPKDPPNLEDVYRQRYVDAWNRWLRDLALLPFGPKKESPPVKDAAASADDLANAIRALDGLVRDARPALPQVLQTVGRGREAVQGPSNLRRGKASWYAGCGKPLGKSVDWGKQAYKEMKIPRECKGVQELVAPYSQLANQGKPTDEEGESGGAREDYQKYLAAAKTLRTTLYRIKESTERNAEALKLVQATMGTTGDLWALDVARNEFMASLQSRLAGVGFEIAESGLNKALRDVEGLAFRALLPMATLAINEQWKNQIAVRWKNLKSSLVQQMIPEEESCKQRMDFLRKDLGDFVSKSLAPFYVGNNLVGCNLKQMAPPFDQQMALSGGACSQIRNAHQVGEVITDCPKAMGGGGGSSKRDLVRADVNPPKTNDCVVQASDLRFDRGDKVFACSIITEHCSETSTIKTSQRAKLSVQWQNRSSFTTLYEHDYAEELLAHGTRSGNDVIIKLPPEKAPNHCPGFVIVLHLAPGAGGPAPKVADTRWKTTDLPDSLR